MPTNNGKPPSNRKLPRSKQGKLEMLKQVSDELAATDPTTAGLERLLARLDAEWTDPPHAASHAGTATAPKCTRDVVRAVLKHVSQGMPVMTAFGLEGISGNLLGEWADAGRRGRQPYQLVTELLRGASDLAEAHHTRIVAAAAILDWRASAWWLERRRPGHWGRQVDASSDSNVSPQFAGALVAKQAASAPTLHLPALPPTEWDEGSECCREER